MCILHAFLIIHRALKASFARCSCIALKIKPTGGEKKNTTPEPKNNCTQTHAATATL